MHRKMCRGLLSSLVLLSLLQLPSFEAALAQQRRTAQPRQQSLRCTGAKNEFTCGDKQCVPSTSVCNGVNDCQDGSDEDAEHCTVIQTGPCNGRKRTKNLCDEATPERPQTEEQNVTHQFFCHSEVLKQDKSILLSCSNHVWTPPTTHCTRVCDPLVLPTSNVTCMRNGKKVNCSQPLLVGTKIYPRCEFYYRPNVKEIVCQENGEWSEEKVDCVAECGRQFKDKMRYTREMRSAEFREFPWSAAIYYTKAGTTDPILIPGTIISPYLIVTTAINFYADYEEGTLTTESVNILVAKRTKEAEAMDDQFQKSYKVRGIYFTETGFQTSDSSSSSENIAMIELDEKLVLSPSVYPACVNWDKNETLYPKEGDIGQVPHTLTIHEANATATTQHETLQTQALRYVSHDQCVNTDTMKSIPHVVRFDNFCGEPISAPAPCDGAFIFLETNTNRFYVQGLVDGITPSTDSPPTFTSTFVDLSVHADWMNAIRKMNEDRLVNNEIRLEVEAADLSTICSKDGDADIATDDPVDTRFGKGKEDSQKDDSQNEKKPEGCLLPTKASLNANNYSITCPVNNENNSCRRIKENTAVPEYASIKIGCKEGFTMNKSLEEALCFKGQWNPALTECTKICEKLPKFDNGNFTCYEEEEEVKCSDSLKIGTKLVPQCKAAYKTERDTESHEFMCNEDGKWIGTLPKCIKKSAKEDAQSKSKTPANTRNGNQGKNNQPSLHARSPSYAPSNAKTTNQTSSSKPSQTKPKQPQANIHGANHSKSSQPSNNTKGGVNPGTKQSPNNTKEGSHPKSNQPPSNARTKPGQSSSKTPPAGQPKKNQRPTDGHKKNETQSADREDQPDDKEENKNTTDKDDDKNTTDKNDDKMNDDKNDNTNDDKNEDKEDDKNEENEDKNEDKDNENEKCSEDEFSCGKLCMPNSAMCNGTMECDDGSDESTESCKILSTKSCSPKNDQADYCDTQATPKTKSKKPVNDEKHSFLCNVKLMNDTEGIPLNCVNGVSTPSTIPCTRVCKNVTLIASGLDCYRNDVTVDCKKPLLVGTKVVPRCEAGYKPNFNGTTCNEKGEWDYPIIECIPECGTSSKNKTKTTKTIRPAQFREFPWNVAVYKKIEDTPILFAGIIISPYLVLTNAHCCSNELANNQSTNLFEVVVGKRSSTEDTEDDEFQKTIKVKVVHLMDKVDPNSESLALLELAEKVTSCAAVQPACVNWHKNDTLSPRDGTLGQVAHWRTRDRSNVDTTHEVLQAVSMTLHTREVCQKRVHRDFVKFLTKDSFCVEPISMTTPAHRGAGFIYEDRSTKLNYVQGVIYFTGIQEGQTATFTNMFLNVSTHIDWINSIRRKTEKRLHRDWVLNTRVFATNDVCKSPSDTNTHENNEGDANARSGGAADNKPDDFMANGCELPDKTWLYLDYNVSCLPSRQEKECKKADSRGVVPEFASLTLSCNEGYVTNGSEEVVCFRKQWSPAIEPCRKICENLELENVTLKCFWEDKRIDCNGELKSGTTAVVECAPYHQSQKSLPKLVCDDYGHWKGAEEVACSYFNPWDGEGEYFKYTVQV